MAKAVIILGSQKDAEYGKKISSELKKFEIDSVLRIASAHKTPMKCYEIIREYENENVVFITVAGRSNALSGFVDGQTFCPVLAAPPYSEMFAGADIFSSLRMPSGIAPMVVLEAENVAVATAKIIGLKDEVVRAKVKEYQAKMKERLEKEDREVFANC